MQKYKSYEWILFCSFMIFHFIIKGGALLQNVTIQLTDSKIFSGNLSSEINSNVHFIYNRSTANTIKKRELGFIMKRATTTTSTTTKNPSTINTKSIKTNSVNSVSTKSLSSSSPKPSVPIEDGSADSGYIYFSITICKLPNINGDSSIDTTLKVYVSSDPNEPKPGPNSPSSPTSYHVVKNGFAGFKIDTSSLSSQVVYIGLFAPNQSGVVGNYSYQIGASTGGKFL